MHSQGKKELQMGSLEDEGAFKFELESTNSSSPLARKFNSSDIGPLSHVSDMMAPPKMTRSRLVQNIEIVIFRAKINVLLPFGPLAVILHYLTKNHGWVFFFSLVGITPLAERLGYATEQLAFYTGPTVGGLLNATFGNATEMIISLYALKHGMIRIVQQSLLGSILSNMLLVLGCSFFIGGLFCHKKDPLKKDQVFNKAAAVVNSGLLLMAVMGIMFPAVLHFTHSEVHFGKSELALSRFSSCIMLVAYACYLFFQLKTQQSQYMPIDEETVDHNEVDSDDEELPDITQWEAVCWLAALTLWISLLSGYLVDAIVGASDSWNMPVAFISVILLPIVGNAAEHASAIMFATKDKLIPFCVVVGWVLGKPMDLNFQLFETASLFITVLVVAFMLQSNNTRAEIWADNVSLQPFTHHQWRSHREESIQKVRKRTIHFHAVDARGNNLAGANISVSLVTARFPFVNKDDGVLGDVVAAHYGGLVCSTRDEEWDSWVEAEDFFNDGLKVGQFGDVIFFNKSVFSNDLVKLGKYFFVDLRLSEDFSHAPFNCARRGVGSSDEHVLHMPPPAKLGVPTTSRISDTISFNSLPSFLVLSKRLFEHTRLLTRLAETTKVESAMLAGVLDFQAEYRFVRRPWTCKEI